MLTIAVSSRALFDTEDGDAIFRKEGQAAFDAYMRDKETVPLRPGPATSNRSGPVRREPQQAAVVLQRAAPAGC